MTLDEAILHAEEVAEEKETEGKLLCQSEGASIGCLACAEEHRQLAEWLKELKRLKENETKNDGTEYCEQDQFVCHKCGIELQDWHRVERDPDDGDVTYHEYTLRYCPHCGRKIVEE